MSNSATTDDLKDLPKFDTTELPPNVHTLDVDNNSGHDLAHTPSVRFRTKRFVKSLASKDAWLGNYVSEQQSHAESKTDR